MIKKLLCFFLISLTLWQLNSQEREIELPAITTYLQIDSNVVEQRQVLTSEEIEKLNPESLTQLLASVGMQLLSYGSYGLETKPSIRGFTDETVRVVIDGVCMNNPQYGTFDFSIINVADIEKIEIVRGGFTEGVSDEGAVGGVIYITTKAQQLGHHFDADLSLKSYFNINQPLDFVSQKIGYSGQLGESTFVKESFKGTWAENKYLYHPLVGNNVYYFDFGEKEERENAQVYDAQNDFKLTSYFGNGNSFTVGDLFYFGNKHTPGLEYSNNQGLQKDLNNMLSFDFVMPSVNDSLLLQNTLAYIYDKRLYDDAMQNSRHNINTLRYVLSSKYYKFENYTQLAGLTIDYVHLNSTDDGIHNQFTGTFKETSQFTAGNLSFSVPLAVKFCNNNVEFIPKAGLKSRFEYADLLLNFYRMVQFPNMDDLYWDDGTFKGNPDLKPEKGWGGEITVNVHDILVPFSVSIFSNYYSEKIQWVGTEVQNVASAFYLGTDVAVEKELFQGRSKIRVNGEYLYTRLLDKKNQLTYGKKIMWTPDFTAGFLFSYSWDFGTVSFDGSYTGKRFVSNINGAFLRPFVLLNFGIDFAEIKKMVPYFRIDNLLNTSYQSVTGYPMPGITLTIGIKTKVEVN